MAASSGDRLAPPAGALAQLLGAQPDRAAGPGRTVARTLAPGLGRTLADRAAADGVPAATPLLAAWLLLLVRWAATRAAASPRAIEALGSRAAWLHAVAAEQAAGPAGDTDWQWSDVVSAPAPGQLLSFQCALDASGGRLSATFPDAVDAGLVECLLERIEAVAALLGDPASAPPDRIDLLGPAQRELLLARWNPAVAPGDPAATVHGRFAAQAVAQPDAVALVDGEAQIRYAALEARASALAGALVAEGVRPGAVVAVALDRSAAAIVALLAILKAGACYLPLDAAYPRARLAFMLEDAAVALVLTSRERAGAMREATQAPVRLVEELAAAGAAGAAVPAAADDLAYVMYTSGSTGTPKGVPIRHDAVLRLVLEARYVRLGPGTAMLHAAPLGFDASTLEIWGPLLTGGTCVLHPEELPTPAGLATRIRACGVTSAWLTAALFNAVVDDDPRHLQGLRQLLVGGEALSVAHVRRVLDALPDLALVNGYGPTECTTFATTYAIPRPLPAAMRSIPIGRPIQATRTFILGPDLELLPAGAVGRLHLGGRGLARGYLNRPELTAERFIDSPFDAGERLYDTGDLARYLADGNIEFLGRADQQVKIRGYRIEPGEIEAALAAHPAVKACAVLPVAGPGGDTALVAYVVAADPGAAPGAAALRAHLAQALPPYMVPATFVALERLPVTVNGKLDRAALPRPLPARPDLQAPYQAPLESGEERLCAAFAEILGFDRVGRLDNFFELGGNSLQVLRVLARLGRDGAHGLTAPAFFREPTPAALAPALPVRATAAPARDAASEASARPQDEPVAIIAVAGRFPGAGDVETFWDNLCAGRDGISRFEDGTLDPSLPPALVNDPRYVKARGILADVELFDAAFFGISPREADLMDPQQRLFMELCWECLERAGHVPDDGKVPIGVFGGMYNATYWRHHVQARPDLVENVGEFAVMLANEKDYIATRTAHRLNLTGPAVSVHTACSTSLVAIAQAFWSLRQGQCRMALAGGASITCPPRSGYLFQDGAMLSPDGATRSFDADAQGTVFSDGAAVVLLKRLSDALEDGDEVLAVIRGVGVNNDGRAKASFTAPSVDGQAAVIAQALEVAGVAARTIGYVEAHGTATPIGDPVEVEALAQAFRRHTADTAFCRLGSLKSNVGHMVIAAGAAGVIKTALALANERIPPTIHFRSPNAMIRFAETPFVVNDRLTAWPRTAAPRRAGVSGFGVGGTNAHAVLEEAPVRAPAVPGRGPQRLQLSARSAQALAAMESRLADHLEAHPALDLADVAFTLQHGRSRFMHRSAVVAASAAQAVAVLREPAHAARRAGVAGARAPAVAWLFPGQGSQYARMGSGLAEFDPAFAAALEDAIAAVQPGLAFDLRARLADADPDALRATEATQPALFCIEFALARAWQSRGLQPAALIGHSVGEFVAATLAGVMTLADAGRLVAARGALLQALPGGAMLSVRLPVAALRERLPQALDLAAENAPGACVVAGPEAAIEAFAAACEADGIAVRRLATSHAFHSSMMDPAVDAFEALVRGVPLHAPTLPIVSTATGAWLTDAQAVDPRHWARQLREPVRFAPALAALLARHPEAALLEVGPRDALSSLARQQGQRPDATLVVPSLGAAAELEAERLQLATAQLWCAGVETVSEAARPAVGRRRVRLPTYPFERRRHWVDAAPAAARPAAPAPAPAAAAPPPPEPRLPLVTGNPVMPASPAAVPRRAALLDRLRELFSDVSGLDLADADPARPFLDYGIDSLTLTQVAMQTRKRFGVAVTFRQMSESCRSFDTLAQFLDQAMPPDEAPAAAAAPAPVAAPVLAVASVPAATLGAMPAVPAAGDFVQEVIRQQMALMARQLELLGGAAAAPAPAAAPPVAAAPAPAAPVPAPAAAAPVEEAATPQRYDVKKAFGAIARIHTQSGTISARQRARLEAFERRYVERTRASKAYTAAHRNHLADPRIVNGFRPLTKEITYQIVIERSRGSKLWDIDGNEYVDVLNGFGMNLFGWQPEFVQEAVRRQLDAGYEIGPQHPLAGEVADLVCGLTGFDRAGLCNTGSEAVMAAVRIARTVTCRSTVVLFTGSYHGTFDEVLVRAGREARGIPAAPGIMPNVFDDVRVLDYGSPESLEFIRRHADDLAAVLVEPVQSRRPEFQPVEYLKQLREITEASGTCLIFDEVITGFRAHPGGVQAMFDVRADLATYGKVIGGGFPIGVVAGKRAYMDALDGGAWNFGDASVPTVGVTYFAGTFVRHPLALAAAKASLLHLQREGAALQEQLTLGTAAMADELNAHCRAVGAPIEIRHFSSLWRVAWLEDHPLQDLLFAMMRSRGVHILDNFPCFMTTAHTPQDIARIKSAFKESVAELQQAEFLPARAAAPTRALDPAVPPVPGARLGRGPDGSPQWYVASPDEPGKYVPVSSL